MSVTDRHFPVFRVFLHFFVTVGDGRFWYGEQTNKNKRESLWKMLMTYNNTYSKIVVEARK